MHWRCRHPPSTLRSTRLKACCHQRLILARGSTTRADCEPRSYATVVAAPQPRSALLAYEGSGEDPGRIGPHGPKLLPRPVRPKDGGSTNSSGSSKKGGDRRRGFGGGGGGGGGRGPAGAGERTLASLAAYSGLVGTTALVLGNLLGIDLWGEFDWTSLEDVRLAAIISVPLQLANAALLLPSYSAPQRLPDMGNLEAMEAKLRDEHEKQQQHGADESPTAPSPPSTGAAGAQAAAVATATTASAASDATSTPSPSPSEPAPAFQEEDPSSPPAAAAAPNSSSNGSPQPPGALGEGFVAAEAWGRSGSDDAPKPAAGEDGWTALRSALHLAQGYYISNNPTARLTPAAEAAYTFVDSAGGEMLYRGVALTWLASWLQDRVYEAGADEALTYRLPAAAEALGLTGLRDAIAELGVYGSCEGAIAAATAAFVVWSVTSRSRRAAQRLEQILSLASSSSSASSTSSSSPVSSSSKTGPNGRSASTTTTSGDNGASAKDRGKAAAAGGASASAVARAAAQVLFGAGGPSVGAANAGAVMQRAAAIQAARDAFQILLINGVFIATDGNLAATYTVSVINQLAISAMQRRGVRRLKERSAALAQELKAYNAQMQRIANKYKDKLSKDTTTRLEALDGDSSKPSPTASSSSSSNSSGGGESAAFVAAALGTAAVGEPATATVDSGTGASTNTSTSGGSNDSSSSSLVRALAMLDALVPEPPKLASTGQKAPSYTPAQPPQPQEQRQEKKEL